LRETAAEQGREARNVAGIRAQDEAVATTGERRRTFAAREAASRAVTAIVTGNRDAP
jgi:hypothetical protein